MHLATKKLWLAYLVSVGLVSASETGRSSSEGLEALLQDDDAADADFANLWARNKRNIQARAADDAQTSLTLDSTQVQAAYASQGLNASDPNITPSLTSTNNFINFCLTQDVPLTNGQQVTNGSCSPTPMGRILAKDKIPSCKFIYPKNGALLPANTTFTVKLATSNLDSGFYSNSETNYLAAPQTTNDNGVLRGHAHIVIETVPNYISEAPLDPAHFAFFKAMNVGAVDGVLSVNITGGIGPGIYRLSSLTTAINHQPPLVAVAQRGSVEDAIYFRVSSNDF